MADARSQGAGMPQWSVRPARASDTASLAAVNAVASTAPGDRAEGTSRVPPLEIGAFAHLLEPRTGLVYVAEAGGSIVGYLALQRAAHPAVAGRSPIQLWQLYVIPAFQGSGVAAQLMSAALGHARAARHDVMWLGVCEENHRAIAFYRRQGFEALGVHEVGTASHAHRDVVMSRAVP
jgi:ribosomal protein S18 acetylase RimI-like enzyme